MGSTKTKTELRDEDHEQHKSWLADIIMQMNMKPSQLAVAARLSESSVLRILNNPTYRGTLSPTTIRAICDYTGLAGPGGFPPAKQIPVGQRQDAVPYMPPTADNDPINAILQGRPGLEAWVMTSELLALQGVRQGDILITDETLTAQNGDIVLAQVPGYNGAIKTFRLYQQPNLLAMSLSPVAVVTVPVDGNIGKILAVVTDLVRRR